MSKFINPFTDYGFKLIFGREVSKNLLIEFLNDLLEGERVITDLTFLNNEQLPDYPEGRGIIYDVYCTTDTGEKIIVEMQNRMQSNFKERSIFYLSRAIVNQGRTGHDWKFEIKAVYGVFLMNFIMDKHAPISIIFMLAADFLYFGLCFLVWIHAVKPFLPVHIGRFGHLSIGEKVF